MIERTYLLEARVMHNDMIGPTTIVLPVASETMAKAVEKGEGIIMDLLRPDRITLTSCHLSAD